MDSVNPFMSDDRASSTVEEYWWIREHTAAVYSIIALIPYVTSPFLSLKWRLTNISTVNIGLSEVLISARRTWMMICSAYGNIPLIWCTCEFDAVATMFNQTLFELRLTRRINDRTNDMFSMRKEVSTFTYPYHPSPI